MKKSQRKTKVCPKCSEEKSVNDFGRDASRPDGRYTYCKDCRRKPNLREKKIEELASAGLKECSKCRKAKPFSAFENDASKRFGVTSRCRKCKKEARKEKASAWRADKQYRQRLREARMNICWKCEKVKKFSEFLTSRTSKFGIQNLCKECSRIFRYRNCTYRVKSDRDYVRWEVFESDQFTCYLCEEVLDPENRSPHPKSLTIDHVVPLSRGGEDLRHNVRTACMECNQRKGDQPLEDFLAQDLQVAGP